MKKAKNNSVTKIVTVTKTKKTIKARASEKKLAKLGTYLDGDGFPMQDVYCTDVCKQWGVKSTDDCSEISTLKKCIILMQNDYFVPTKSFKKWAILQPAYLVARIRNAEAQELRFFRRQMAKYGITI